VATLVRRTLGRVAARSPRGRRLLERVAAELRAAVEGADDGVYGGRYFGAGRDALDRMGLSGYERYDRATSNADVAAYLVWKHFRVERALDVGCAMGFVVEALRELGVDAEGVDVSAYAVDHAAPGARGHLGQASLLERLPFPDSAFDMVTVLETLEHLPPESVPAAVAELRRVCRGHVVATIPSFGPNQAGPGGWFQVKVRDDRVAYYESLGSHYEGPVPHIDIYRDVRGEPVEGHLTMASFSWWTKRFEEAGFVRSIDLERRLYRDVERFGLLIYWNLYVFHLPGAAPAREPVRSGDDTAALERRWGLDQRAAAAASRPRRPEEEAASAALAAAVAEP
jgi:SAM-dependent methyltransferase